MRWMHSRLNIAGLAGASLVGLVVAVGLAVWALWSPLGGSSTAQATGPHLTVNKECSLSGGMFTFTFTLTNDGDTDLIRWKVEDTTLGTITWEFPAQIAVGETQTVTLTKTQLPNDGLCNWAEFSYRTASWEVVKARPECCIEQQPGELRVRKLNADGSLWSTPAVTFHICPGVVATCDGSEPGAISVTVGNGNPNPSNPIPREPGDYTVCEVPPPDHTVEPSICQTVTVPTGATVTVTFKNILRRGELVVRKLNADGSLWSTPAVTFHICPGVVATCDGTEPGAISVTVGDGNPNPSNPIPREPGDYTVCEVPPPDHIVEPSTCQMVTVPPDATVTVTFKNIRRDGEGCTPGFWKNHLDAWGPTGFSPSDDFDSTFGVDLFDPDITLEEAVNAKGGGVKKLARHGTAALLGAAHPGVAYPFTVAEVIAAVQAGDADALAKANELGCPID